jgi:hypothetical protein
VDGDASALQDCFDAGEVAVGQAQRHVIDLAAGVDNFLVFDLEEGDTLVAAFQETLPVPFMVDFHAEKLNVKFPRAREILDVKDDMVKAGDFEWRIHFNPP